MKNIKKQCLSCKILCTQNVIAYNLTENVDMLTICMSKDYNNINKPGPNETLEKPRTTKTTKNDATMTI